MGNKAARSGGLDGIRGIAVLAVVLFHAGVPHIHDGALGVDLFFALSGWLITSKLMNEIQVQGRLDILRFYGRRALRLLPALVPVVILSPLIAQIALGPDTRRETERAAIATVFYVTNWSDIHGQVPGLFGHTWSLAVEGQFYLVWPLIVIVTARRSIKLIAPTAVLLSSLAIIERAVLTGHVSYLRVYQGTDTRADALLIACAAAAAVSTATDEQVVRYRRALGLAGWPALVGVMIVLIKSWDTSTASGMVLAHLTATVLATVLVAAVATNGEARLSTVLAFRPLAWIGLVSYGLYLWHYLFVIPLVIKGHGGTVAFFVGGGGALLVAAASFYGLERPVQRRLEHYVHVRRREDAVSLRF